MKRRDIMYNRSAIPAAAISGHTQQLPGRVPQEFIEAMKRLTSDMSTKTQPAETAQSSAAKWKSSFKPIDKKDGETEEQSTESTGLYDPYSPLTSDSEVELTQAQDHNHAPSSQDNNLKRQRLSPDRGFHDTRHWDSAYIEAASPPLDEREFSPGTRPAENRALSPGGRVPERWADSESRDRPGYGSMSGPLEHRGFSPDGPIHGSSTQRFPPSYGGQRTNGEETIALPEYRREMTTTVRLSPPRLPRDYQHQLAYVDTGLDRDPPPTKVERNRSRTVIMDKSAITCDLCEVELATGQELDDHLDSKSHWDTLAYIQQNNNYDDLAIAFLQEVMLYKSHQCSRTIENSALQALQDNDHMTKVEMFHCAACKVFITTSAAEVQTHITSQEHLSNTKEFEMQQRHACLSKAETMMKELQPQFEHFLEGGTPFEGQK